MAGRNQHHIPQFFQRGFGIPTKGKPKEIWEFTKDGEPEKTLIKDAAMGFDFYSPPSTDGEKTLDGKITAIENPISRKVLAIRSLPAGSSVDAADAAEVVTHLAPRTSHLRSVFTRGLAGLLEGAAEVFGDEHNVRRLLGLDGPAPSDRFREQVAQVIHENPVFSLIQAPQHLLEKVAFRHIQENFEQFQAQQAPLIEAFLSNLMPRAEATARDGHNKALESILEKNVRRDDLKSFEWRVEAAPSEGAILPDCIALGLRQADPPCPFMMAERAELTGVVMPLSSKLVMVGLKPGASPPSLADVNTDAAACSHAFFLAGSKSAAIASLAGRIAERSTTVVDEAIVTALDEYRPSKEPSEEEGQTAEADAENEPGATGKFSFTLHMPDWGDPEIAKQIGETITYLIGQLGRAIPLDRLDAVTIANDYEGALAVVDQGGGTALPPRPDVEEIGLSVCAHLPVIKDGVVKSHLVLAAGLGEALVIEGHPSARLALHLVIYELIDVAVTRWMDDAISGKEAEINIDPFRGHLFSHAASALHRYLPSRLSADFAEENAIEAYRELLVRAVGRTFRLGRAARLQFRADGNFDALMASLIPWPPKSCATRQCFLAMRMV